MSTPFAVAVAFVTFVPVSDVDALLLERLLELRGHGLVLDRHETRQQLDDGHLAAEAAVDRRELDADGAAAHDDQRLRNLLEVNRLVAGDDARVIDLDARHAARRRAGRDDDLLRLERLLVALEDFHLARPASRAVPLIQSILFFLNRNSTPLVSPSTILSLRVCTCFMSMAGVPVGNRHAPLLRVLNHLQRVGVLEQRLGGNAAPDQTGAAERLLLLDDGDLLPKLRRANRGDVSAGAGADHDDIVRFRQ